MISKNILASEVTHITQGMRYEFGSVGVVCSTEEMSGPQNLRVQKLMSKRSMGLCTRCTRANTFSGLHLTLILLFKRP